MVDCMLKRVFSIAPLALLALAAACSQTGTNTDPGATSIDEQRALDEAAQMLDQQRQPEEAVPTKPNEEPKS